MKIIGFALSCTCMTKVRGNLLHKELFNVFFMCRPRLKIFAHELVHFWDYLLLFFLSTLFFIQVYLFEFLNLCPTSNNNHSPINSKKNPYKKQLVKKLLCKLHEHDQKANCLRIYKVTMRTKIWIIEI